MIRITERTNTPPTLQSHQVVSAKQELNDKASSGETIQSSDFHSAYWRAQDVKDNLFEGQKAKCCYCENFRSPSREFDAEHFRPKAGVAGEPNHPGYWWLAYEWSNLLYACKTCNETYKKTQFPIDGERACRPEDDLDVENPALVNPIDEDPEEFIGFDWQRSYGKMVRAYPLDDNDRGSKTINIVGLNRPELLEERAEIVPFLQDLARGIKVADARDRFDIVEELASKIRLQTSSKRRFTAFHRAFFRAQELGKYIADD